MSGKIGKIGILRSYRVLGSLGVVLFIVSAASAQQNRPGAVYAAPPQQQDQYPQDPRQQGPPEQAAPQTLTLPAGTVIRVRVDEWLSSDRNLPGDEFSAVLDQPIVVDGWVVARRGQLESGRVSMAQKAGRTTGTSQLGVDLADLTLVDGQRVPIQTQMVRSSAGTSHGQDAAAMGTTSGVGAAIGAIADGGAGAAIGAGAGAAAGIIGVLSTRGKPTVVPPETILSFRLHAPVQISTDKSQFAFQPVMQEDYDSQPPYGRQQRNERVNNDGPEYPPPPDYGYPVYSSPYPYPYTYYYPSFSFGYYGGYRYGPRFGGYRGGFRGHRGFRR